MAEIYKIHKVRSQTNKNKVYDVIIWNDMFGTCQCDSYVFRGKCKHIEFIKNKYYGKNDSKTI